MNRIVPLLSAAALINACSPGDERVRARNAETVHKVFSEVWSKGSIELIDDLFTEDFVGHFPAGTVHGREGVTARVVAHRTAFPDWTEEAEDMIVDGDRVVVRFTSRGTNLGRFLGKPATGNRAEISEVAIFRLSEGKIDEQWVYPDMLSLQRQLGHREQPPAPAFAQLETSRVAIDDAYRDWVDAANAKDLDRWTSFLAAEPLFLPPNHPVLRGERAIRDFYARLFADDLFALNCSQEDIEVAEAQDMAWSTGSCEAIFTALDGTPARGSSKWAKVWTRLPNGDWKCALNSWSMNGPSE